MCWLCKIGLGIFYYVVVVVNCYSATDYCKADVCGGSKEHTLCKFSDISPNCVDYERTILSAKDKQRILDKINSRRDKVASGEIRSLPAAESLIKLEWNDELALSAQMWADQCTQNGQEIEDTCRDLENTRVGQNVATIYGESPGLSPHVLVDLWYMELLNINTSGIASYKPSSVTGLQHYDYFTQLVWGVTTSVGCGGVKFKEIEINSSAPKKRTVYRLVCNFAPAGNGVGEAVYTTGNPCFKCPKLYLCDTQYQHLCSKSETSSNIYKISKTYSTFQFLEKYSSEMKKGTTFNPIHTTLTTVSKGETQTPESSDSGESFDLLSYLFDTTSSVTEMTQSTPKCNDVVIVEEFVRLLKNKLNNEQMIRDYLFNTKAFNIDSSVTDATVAAIVQHIYSKNIPTTTTVATESDVVNSTLLANLVEAIIFRHNDKSSVTEKTFPDVSLSYNNVKPVKIHASLGEVQTNKEFSGHYFFPEDEGEKSESDTTESYYDLTYLPDSTLSEIDFRIDDIDKTKRTRNFLDEVLEEELLKEGVTEDMLPSIKIRVSVENVENKRVAEAPNQGVNLDENLRFEKQVINAINTFSRKLRRIKRRSREKKCDYDSKNKPSNFYINYYELLKTLATDIKDLKLYERFSCSYNRSFCFLSIYKPLLIYILILQTFLIYIY